jgi:hypothetical protein
MKPVVVIIPTLLVVSGVLCFFLLPLPLHLRAILLASDVLAAAFIGFVLFRRFHS